MPSENENTDLFRALKWSDIEEWTGSKTVSKGKEYQREGRVKELKRIPEKGYLQWCGEEGNISQRLP